MPYSNPAQTAVYTLATGTETAITVVESTATTTEDAYAKTLYVQTGATVITPTIKSGGQIHASNGGVVSGATIIGNNTARLYGRRGGVISGAVVSGGNLWGFDVPAETASAGRPAIIVRDATVYTGELTLRGVNASGADIRIYGGVNYLQNGAYASGVTLYGGTLNMQIQTAATIVDSGARTIKVDALRLSGGRVNAYEYATISGAEVTGGTLVVNKGAGVFALDLRGGTVNVLSGGAVRAMTGAVLTNLTAVSGAVVNYATNADAEGATICGANTNIAANVMTFSGKVLDVAITNGVVTNLGNNGNAYKMGVGEGITVDDAVFRTGQRLYVREGAVVRNATVNAGGTLNGCKGGLISGAVVSGGNLFVFDAPGDTVSANRPAIVARDITVFTGGLTLRGVNASGANIKIYGGDNAVQNGAYASGLSLYGGTLNLQIQAALVDGARTIKVDDLHLYGGAVNAYNYANISGAQVTDGTLNVKAGATVSALDARGGTVNVSSGGTVHAKTGARLTDLNAVAGAVIDYANNVDAEGATICGAKTNIAANVLTFSGNTLDVAIADGVVTNLGNNGSAYKLGIGEGITADDAVFGANQRLYVRDGAVVRNATVNNGGTLNGCKGGLISGAVVSGGNLYVFDAPSDTVSANRAAIVARDITVSTGALTLRGINASGIDIKLYSGVNYLQNGAYASGLSLYGGTLNMQINAAATAVDSGAKTINVDDLHLYGGNLYASAYANISGAEVTGGTLIVSSGARVDAATGTGGEIQVQNGAAIDNATLKIGGYLGLLAGADTGKKLTFDFTGADGNKTRLVNNLSRVSAETKLFAIGLTEGNSYTIANTGATDRTVNCAWSIYDNAIRAGENYTNAFAGMTYAFNATGTAIATTAFDIGAAKSVARAITDADTVLNGTDRAAKWDAATDYTASVTLADGTLAGDAWLVIDGTNVSTALYGATGTFEHTVNIEAKSGTVRNLAAGATAGGSVAGVKLILDGADVAGTAYAGGFGSVAGKTETLVTTGSFSKDFYAGALANKLTDATSVGDVSMTIDGGTFSGNIYGASAVKTDTNKRNGTRHTAGDVTLTVTGGSTTKGTQACIFAGGYATGDATGTVYTVDSVTAAISGGNWGTAAGGRGVFGGIFASGVEAQVIGDVNITISDDATMGNVYGGGWAQKENAKSIVGDVNINIAGGTVTNVFGGGSHSTSGGTTEAGDVTITVSGGDITGAIYARGQLEGDTTGAASVIFTGATDFACDVYGYSYVGSETGDAALSFTGYTGEFAGALGGFNGITLDGSTAMTLLTESGNVSNGAWEFDFTGRADTLAGTSLLTWVNADFAGDTVRVNFTDAAQAAAEWSIATAAFDATTTFDLYIGGTEIASVAYDTAISDGDWAGWKFTDENGTLKFKQLA